MENYGTLWLKETGNKLDDFDGVCGDLANEIVQWLDEKKIPNTLVWIGPNKNGMITAHYPSGKKKWFFHMVVASNGRIHDPWKKEVLTSYKYFSAVFPKQTVFVEHRDNKYLGALVRAEVRRDGRLISKR